MEQAVSCAVLNDSAQSAPLLIEAVLALVRLRQQARAPDTLFNLAREGDLKTAVDWLAVFDADPFWRQAALLAIAWLAPSDRRNETRKLRDRIAADPLHLLGEQYEFLEPT